MEKIFTQYYFDKFWSSHESASGKGSELQYTEKLRMFLVGFFDRKGIQSIVDAPCGDFNWMFAVLNQFPKINYLGLDIVRPMIIRNETFYGNNRIKFQHTDLCSSNLQFFGCDFLLSRDFLFHLSFQDAQGFIKKLNETNPKYVALTNHPSCVENSDISTGGYREINLFLPPFSCSSANIIARCDDFVKGFPVREIVIFDGSPFHAF